MSDAPTLNRGIGASGKCRSCGVMIHFAKSYTTGKLMPMQPDDVGEWTIENGVAKHVGPVPAQLEIGAPAPVQRWTSHFSVCPQAEQWRQPR
jgi:hypothetical protein